MLLFFLRRPHTISRVRYKHKYHLFFLKSNSHISVFGVFKPFSVPSLRRHNDMIRWPPTWRALARMNWPVYVILFIFNEIKLQLMYTPSHKHTHIMYAHTHTRTYMTQHMWVIFDEYCEIDLCAQRLFFTYIEIYQVLFNKSFQYAQSTSYARSPKVATFCSNICRTFSHQYFINLYFYTYNRWNLTLYFKRVSNASFDLYLR